MDFHSVKLEKLFSKLGSREDGLSTQDAVKRLEVYGFNEIEKKHEVSALKILLQQFKSALIILLVVAGVVLIYLGFTGDVSNLIDGGLILAIVLVNGILGFVQDFRAEKSMRELEKMTAPTSKVFRDGKLVEIPSREIVPGDVVYIEEGDIVPADGRVVESVDLEVDESSLTGESEPVSKRPTVLPESTPLAERTNMVYMNSKVMRGHGKILIVATNGKTEIGKIAKQLESMEEGLSPFQLEMNELGKKIGIAILIIVGVIITVQVVLNKETSLVQVVTMAIALAVAAVPEGLPAVITLTLALSTRRMLKKNVLVRRLSVIEELSSVDVICSDKTGTLTKGEMDVVAIATCNEVLSSREFLKREKNRKSSELLLNAFILCNNSKVINGKLEGDYTEKAFYKFAVKHGIEPKKLEESHPRVEEESFSHETKRMAVKNKFGDREFIFVKGSTESVLRGCTHYYVNGKVEKLTNELREQIMAQEENMSGKALRVLAFAFKEVKPDTSIKDAHGDLVFLALVGLSDIPREGVKETIKLCEQAGIQVKMITGDKSVTAQAIARQIGLGTRALTGADLDSLPTDELSKLVEETDIFARVEPRHKVRILQLLQGNGHVVAMTGDGVNDAPALKRANVGIAMGLRGTSVAKQSSDLILLDDNFVTLVDGIREGRTSFRNIRKFVNYLLTSNIAEVLVVFLSSFFKFLPLTAVQLLLINFFTDGLPAVALGADGPPPDVMKKKPRRGGVIGKRLAYLIVFIGLKKTAMMLSVILTSLFLWGTSVARTVAFFGIILYEFNRISVIRYEEKVSVFSNKLVMLAVVVSAMIALFLIYSPLNSLVGLVPLNLPQITLLVSGVVIGWFLGILITELVMRLTKEASETI